MRITSVSIPEGKVLDNGLAEINMSRLGRVVVLAGPNGSGKTRILGKVSKLCREYPSAAAVRQWSQSISRYEQALVLATPPDVVTFSNLIADHKAALEQVNWMSFSESFEKILCVDWVPKGLNLEDCNSYSVRDLVANAEEMTEPGFRGSRRGCLAYIQSLQNQYWNVTHQLYKGVDRDAVETSYMKLKVLVETVLETTLERDSNANAEIFGRPLAGAALSDGQAVLLQFCIAFHAQGAQLQDTVLIMDEPENHLHPAVLLDVIDRLSTVIGDGQIWIATHSLSLIAQFDADSIWYVERGRVTHAGKSPERVLNGLMGGEERAYRLSSFVDLPAQFALYNYAFQCLHEPQVAPAGTRDPQTNQIHRILSAKGVSRILDYGSGRGRLASELADVSTNSDSDDEPAWDYVAYDVNESNRAVCESAISRLCGDCSNRWFSDIHQIGDRRGSKHFDVVVMCNVLHEIEPREWIVLFGKRSPLLDLLKPDGFLLVVEDHQIPIGENAHSCGFIVLDTTELRKLFRVGEPGVIVADDFRNDGRLKAHLIPATVLSNVTAESRSEALSALKERALDHVRGFRRGTSKADYLTGRRHAFWVQQLANTTLALAELG